MESWYSTQYLKVDVRTCLLYGMPFSMTQNYTYYIITLNVIQLTADIVDLFFIQGRLLTALCIWHGGKTDYELLSNFPSLKIDTVCLVKVEKNVLQQNKCIRGLLGTCEFTSWECKQNASFRQPHRIHVKEMPSYICSSGLNTISKIIHGLQSKLFCWYTDIKIY